MRFMKTLLVSSNTTPQTLFAVMDILLCCSCPITQCVGQAYDRATNMGGVKKGVQALMKKEYARALYVHFITHSLNLCLQFIT